MVDWKERPMLIEYWPDDVEYVMGLDENGTSDIKGIRKLIKDEKKIPDGEKLFTLTGVVMNRRSYDRLKVEMNELKFKYWPPEGYAAYKDTLKRVCFHSREIRHRDTPFNINDYDGFIQELSKMIRGISTRIISSCIDKEYICKQYSEPRHPYHLAVEFILERFCERLNQRKENGIIILESRGRKKEDKFVHKHIVNIVENGTQFHTKEHFQRLSGAYFNPKWSKPDDEKKTFVILELADLISYPIHKFVRTGNKDMAFHAFERKFYHYPKYIGRGLKIFTKKKAPV